MVTWLAVLLALALQTGTQAWHSIPGLRCGFEETCAWKWNSTLVRATSAAFPGYTAAPKVDASNNTNGHYLMVVMTEDGGPKQMLMWSPKYVSTGESCRFKVSLHMGNMVTGSFKILVEIVHNKTSWVVNEKAGNDMQTWEEYSVKIGRLSQEFNIILEITSGKEYPSHVALDNLRLINCFTEPRPVEINCSPTQYKCRNNTCIDKLDVCDMSMDCVEGDDEEQDCDKVPRFARCSFEEGQCGWVNKIDESVDQTSKKSIITWRRHVGPAPNPEQSGPSLDHTYQNISGAYMHVSMVEGKMGSSAILQSPIINPPPWYHNDTASPYFNSCHITFYSNQFGTHSSSLALYLQRVDKPKAKKSRQIALWFSYGRKDNVWSRQVIPIPTNITQKYYLMFEARKGLGKWSDISIDDISMSPKCFGLDVPQNELRGYNYLTAGSFTTESDPQVHEDFENATIYEFGSCNVEGPEGPKPEDCRTVYTNSNTNVTVLTDRYTQGIQKWIVPESGYYTVIGRGAGGGQGTEKKGSSWAAEARTVVELVKGQSLYILVGQQGQNACPKGRERLNISSQCDWRNKDKLENGSNVSIKKKLHEKIKAIAQLEFMGGGGGGGGASYVFTWPKNKEKSPILVAAGGGGLALKETNIAADESRQDGHGMNTSLLPISGDGPINGLNKAGGGGGWLGGNNSFRDESGLALVLGGKGGKGCYVSGGLGMIAGSGGFGGGGGACLGGGGGGGFTGGRAGFEKEDNGEGGYSWVDGLFGKVIPGANPGAGRVFIIPAIPVGCNCDYLCVTLDYHRQYVQCLCPPGWNLSGDNRSCIHPDDEQTKALLWSGIIITMIGIIIGLCFLSTYIYNRYQRKRNATQRRKKMNGTDLPLGQIRPPGSFMTEYNPNYEFGGARLQERLQDLKDIPRNNLRLVKALGQGAFGEVYQGFYRQRDNDAVEMPVAVKVFNVPQTLPELSTSQAEADFLMEALIMNKFVHPNIVHCIGVCFDRHPRYLVIELLAGGDLKSFLREERPKIDKPTCLKMKDLIQIAIDVAKGCKYMEEQRFIHRDIAARNCLLTTKGPGRVVKIADFGMARDIYRSDYYKKGGKAMLPIKWMPPEAFLDGLFTSKTDVWSFGVLLWEVMSLGFMPYAGSTNREVMQMVVAGSRLSPPAQCPGPIYGIMTQCWAVDPIQRPSFPLILERLGYCLQDPQVVGTLLPIFDTIPANEPLKEAEPDMRPPESEGPLQVNGYLVPSPGDSAPTTTPTSISTPTPATTLSESHSTLPLLEFANNNNKMPPITYANVNPLAATGLYTVSSSLPHNSCGFSAC
ncbi:leukocyte tyrosine kinase receptor isoform X2 [Nilaparvata lugens]|uniref:leukocyte tyrosine kinase receptor isoform X2 n=1 Tax=Nilaparvata lugens TaxID=108931 RepID=UPI00193D9278|nr:leukocyte tyrosine kinase receptor isoform X2 [Nilaparvata lugens]